MLTWFDPTILRQAITALAQCKQLKLIVAENRSRYTNTHNKPYLLKLLADGVIDKYYSFDKNVAAHALRRMLYDHENLIRDSSFVVVTDGDLVAPIAWVTASQALLQKCPEVFTVAVPLSLKNLPLHVCPDARTWLKPTIDKGDYAEGPTGLHLLMFRGVELANYLRACRRLSLIDMYMHSYCRSIGKRWAQLKGILAVHLTWDLYAQIGHPYLQLKRSKKRAQLWVKPRSCNFTIYTRESVQRITLPDSGSVFGNPFGE